VFLYVWHNTHLAAEECFLAHVSSFDTEDNVCMQVQRMFYFKSADLSLGTVGSTHRHITDFDQHMKNLRTQPMSVLVLLCTSYTTCLGPIGGHLQEVSNTKYSKSATAYVNGSVESVYKGKCRSQVRYT
jgi:hypothetical protein